MAGDHEFDHSLSIKLDCPVRKKVSGGEGRQVRYGRSGRQVGGSKPT